MNEPEITVQKAFAYLPYDTELESDVEGLAEMVMRALSAPPPTAEERLRQRGRYLIEQARRDTERCGQCGCHEDEHGGDW